MDDAVRYAFNNLTNYLKEGHSPDAAKDFLQFKLGIGSQLVDQALQHYREQAIKVRNIWEPRVLSDGTLIPDEWYPGPTETDIYWPALHGFLDTKPNWNGSPLEALDDGSTKVVSYIQPPWAEKINTRGLVIGYVQSGKTSNFTAVISKAADKGYRLFIVLSGLHNNLRRQTQLRLQEQLVTLNKHSWSPLTSESDDFVDPFPALPMLSHKDHRLLAVVKKNNLRLQNLTSWLNRAKEQGMLEDCPILVIDDEADQASPNTRKRNEKRTAINQLIIDLLKGFPKVAYVGYTATPFANMFIDPTYPHDLYPRHFICDLPRSDDYFGPESLFGREARTPDEPEPPTLDMVRIVGESEKKSLLPPKGKGSAAKFAPTATKSLQDAINWFLLATSARWLRAGEPLHSTMLIHTSALVAAHDRMWEPVVHHIQALKHSLEEGDATIREGLSNQWAQETSRVDGSIWGLAPLDAGAVVDAMPGTIALLGNLEERDAEDCGVVVDNSYSTRRLIYDDDNPLPVIVIGGNTLSRGLTLEGLISSFFVRKAVTYDTLLQMGRWFGYRRGFEDLPRMWVTAELKAQFRALATVEDQIRSEIARYEEEGLLPIQVGVRVRKTKGMQITALNKRYYTKAFKASYSGQRPQTILFNTDSQWLQRNLLAAKRLIGNCVDSRYELERLDNRVILRDVPASLILQFISETDGYQFHANNSELSRDTLEAYIKRCNDADQLNTWNIAVISRKQGVFGDIDLGFKENVNMIARSQLEGAAEEDSVNIGVLTNLVDWVADLDLPQGAPKDLPTLRRLRNESGRPVLLLYPIYRKSPAKQDGRPSQREKADLDLDEDVIGVSIAFPRDTLPDDEKEDYTVVQLPAPSATLSEEEEAEEEEEEYFGNDMDDGEGISNFFEAPESL